MIGTSNSKYIIPHLVARHIPQSVSDLAVNVKKVEEVRHWLRDRLGKRGMLVLTGPAGDLLLTLVHVSLTAWAWVLELKYWLAVAHYSVLLHLKVVGRLPVWGLSVENLVSTLKSGSTQWNRCDFRDNIDYFAWWILYSSLKNIKRLTTEKDQRNLGFQGTVFNIRFLTSLTTW